MAAPLRILDFILRKIGSHGWFSVIRCPFQEGLVVVRGVN